MPTRCNVVLELGLRFIVQLCGKVLCVLFNWTLCENKVPKTNVTLASISIVPCSGPKETKAQSYLVAEDSLFDSLLTTGGFSCVAKRHVTSRSCSEVDPSFAIGHCFKMKEGLRQNVILKILQQTIDVGE